MRIAKRKTADAGAATTLVDRPFLDEMRALEQLLPIAPDEINKRVLTSHLDEADLRAAERLNDMNLRYYERVVQPVLDEWVREVHGRRAGQWWAFVASCAAILAGCLTHGTAAYVLFFVGSFGFCTAIAAWFGSTAAGVGARLSEKLPRSRTGPRGPETS